MNEFTRARRLVAEGLGTAMLLATIVGSGIMAERLAGGNQALALLGASLPTGAMLAVLILIFGPVSGGHFNPAVTLALALRRDICVGDGLCYVLAQVAGGGVGVIVAHIMFELPLIALSTTVRAGPGQWFSEGVAAFGLVLTILGTLRWRPQAVPCAVGLFIMAGYWFTASTAFANPAVTIARALTGSHAGIAPGNVPAFVIAQLSGGVVAAGCAAWLFATAATIARRGAATGRRDNPRIWN